MSLLTELDLITNYLNRSLYYSITQSCSDRPCRIKKIKFGVDLRFDNRFPKVSSFQHVNKSLGHIFKSFGMCFLDFDFTLKLKGIETMEKQLKKGKIKKTKKETLK
jgi:hypothetical protein